MSNNESPVIAIVFTYLTDTYQQTVISGISKACEDKKVKPFFIQDCYPQRNAGLFLPKSDIEKIDGIIIFSSVFEITLGMKGLKEYMSDLPQIPTLCIGSRIDNNSSIQVDNYQGMKTLVDHLIDEHKAKEIAFLGGPDDNGEAYERYLAYLDSLSSHNIPVDQDIVYKGDFAHGDGVKCLEQLVEKNKTNVDAVVCVDDFVALEMQKYQQQDSILKKDCIITGFDDSMYSRFAEPQLTTVSQPLFEIGYQSVQELLSIIRREETERHRTIPLSLVKRESCGCGYFSEMSEYPTKKLSSKAETIIKDFKEKSEDFIKRAEFDIYPAVPTNELLHEVINCCVDQLGKQRQKKLKKSVYELLEQTGPYGFDKDHWFRFFLDIFKDYLSYNEFALVWSDLYSYLVENKNNIQGKEKLITEQILTQVSGIMDNLVSNTSREDFSSILKNCLQILGIRYMLIWLNFEKEPLFAYFNGQVLPNDTDHCAIKDFPPSYMVQLVLDTKAIGRLYIEKTRHSSIFYGNFIQKITKSIESMLLMDKLNKYTTGLESEVAKQTAELRDAYRYIKSIYDTSLILKSSYKSKDLFKVILDELIKILPLDLSTLQIVEKGNYKVVSTIGPGSLNMTGFTYEGREILDIDNSAEEKSLIIDDIQQYEVFKNNSLVKDMHSWLRVPLLYDGAIIGVITAYKEIPGFYTKKHLEILEMFAAQATIALVNASLFEDLLTAKNAAEDANRSKSEFLSNMSHEIRTPMNAIIGFSDMTLNSRQTPEQQRWVSNIKESAESLLSLINDILDISKIENKMLIIEQKEFDLLRLVDQVINIIAVKLDSTKVELLYSLSSNLKNYLIGDELRVRQILLNLLSNAVKFTSEGHIRFDVELQDQDEKSFQLLFSIEDTGIGIEAEKLNYLFDRFTQADSSTTRNYGGTGLGLSICEMLAQLMGGSISAESVLGKGSTFRFSCRFQKGQSIDHEKSLKPSRRMKNSIPQYRNKKVLVVDDTPMNREVVEYYLQRAAIFYESAGNGIEALDKCSKQVYDLILMDLQMPEMDGFESTKKILESTMNAHTPILAMTAHADSQTKNKCLKAGMKTVIPKPIDVNRFYGTLEENLGKAQEQLELSEDSTQALITGINHRSFEPQFYRKLLEEFQESFKGFYRHFVELLSSNKTDEAEREIHSLAGVAGNIGAEALHRSAKLIERQYQNKKAVSKKLLEDFSVELNSLLKGIEVYLKNSRDLYPPAAPKARITLNQRHYSVLRDLVEEQDFTAEEYALQFMGNFKAEEGDEVYREFLLHLKKYDFIEAARNLEKLQKYIEE